MAGDQHERRLGKENAGPTHEIEAVDLGHVVIADDDLRLESRDCDQGVGGTIEYMDATFDVVLKQLGQQVGVGFLVVDNKDGFACREIHRGNGRD